MTLWKAASPSELSSRSVPLPLTATVLLAWREGLQRLVTDVGDHSNVQFEQMKRADASCHECDSHSNSMNTTFFWTMQVIDKYPIEAFGPLAMQAACS